MDVRGPFAAKLRAELMQAHASVTPGLDSFARDLRAVAQRNAALLTKAGLDLENGLIRRDGKWRTFIDQKKSPLLPVAQALRVACGKDWVELDAVEAPTLQGRLLPWTPQLWGSPEKLKNILHWNKAAWLQEGQTIMS